MKYYAQLGADAASKKLLGADLKYIYKNGNVAAYPWTIKKWGGANTFVTDNGTSLYLFNQDSDRTDSHICLWWTVPIDLTNYSVVLLRIQSSGSHQIHFGFTTSPGSTDFVKLVDLIGSVTDDLLAMDISNLTGLHYVTFHAYGYQAKGCTIHRIGFCSR